MLDASYKNREQGIQEVVYNFLKDCEPAPMSNDVSELFLKLAIAGNDFKIPQNEKPFLYQLIDNEQELDIATKKCVIYHIDELLSLGYSRPFYDEVKEEILNYKDVS